MKRQHISKAYSKASDVKSERSCVRIGTGKFTFSNGDFYEGKYQLDVNKCTLVKQDEGIYVTDNLDVYDGKWDNDKFANSQFGIRYNNNARYNGNVDANGTMNGAGTYIFPDESSLTAIWSENKPVSDIVYKDPSGYEWIIESRSNNRLSFTAENHFWNEVCQISIKTDDSSFIQH